MSECYDVVSPNRSNVTRHSFRKRNIQNHVINKFKNKNSTDAADRCSETNIQNLGDLLQSSKCDSEFRIKSSHRKNEYTTVPATNSEAAFSRRVVCKYFFMKVGHKNRLTPKVIYLFTDLLLDAKGSKDSAKYSDPKIFHILDLSIMMLPSINSSTFISTDETSSLASKMTSPIIRRLSKNAEPDTTLHGMLIGSHVKSYCIYSRNAETLTTFFHELADAIEVAKKRHYCDTRPVPKPIAPPWYFSDACVLCDVPLTGLMFSNVVNCILCGQPVCKKCSLESKNTCVTCS